MNLSAPDNAALLPWHEAPWHRLHGQIRSGRMPHGLLLSGPAQSGKSRFVDLLTSTLLCTQDAGPCGQCHQCQLVAAGTHPDHYIITLLEKKTQILVDQIRDLIDWANQTAQQSGWKVCVIEPADKMNIQASNALLKCLEEPPQKTLILLVTDQPNRLLPTLRSRCQRIECHQPGRDESVAWIRAVRSDIDDPELLLDIAGGIPLRAVEHVTPEYLALRQLLADALPGVMSGQRSPVQLAAEISKADAGEVLDIIYQLVTDAIGSEYSEAQGCRNRDLLHAVKAISENGLSACFALIDRIIEAKGIMAGTSNANVQMLLEWVLSPSS